MWNKRPVYRFLFPDNRNFSSRLFVFKSNIYIWIYKIHEFWNSLNYLSYTPNFIQKCNLVSTFLERRLFVTGKNGKPLLNKSLEKY